MVSSSLKKHNESSIKQKKKEVKRPSIITPEIREKFEKINEKLSKKVGEKAIEELWEKFMGSEQFAKLREKYSDKK